MSSEVIEPKKDAHKKPGALRDSFAEEDAPGFFGRHPALSTILVIAVLGGVGFAAKKLTEKPAGPARPPVSIVAILPPPPPPPPKQEEPPPPPPEQKMIEQTPVENEPPPEPQPVDAPPPVDLGTAIKGDGPPDGFGVSGGSGSGRATTTSASTQRSRWGWYAIQVQSRIQQAVRTNRATSAASLRTEVKVWADSTGRITRATLASPTGNAALDAALRDEILTGLQLSEPPPAGMPMPINLRITVRRR